MNICIYRFLTVLLSPVIDLFLFVRKLKNKQDPAKYKERFGYATEKKPKGKLIWLHAASLGEANAILPVVEEILKKYEKKVSILFTTISFNTTEAVQKKLSKYNVIYQYAPVDKYFVIKRFLKHWKPDLLLMTESEFWPNMVTMTKEQGAKIIVINGKITEKTLNKWKTRPTLKRQVFDCVDFCFPQSTENMRNFLQIGVQEMNYVGNLKFDVPTLKSEAAKVKELKGFVQDRTVVMAASTHNPEEKMVAKMHINLKKKYKDLLTFVILRHPKRMEEVYNMLTKELKLKVAVRSKNEKVTKTTDIYLCDTMGEMGNFFTVGETILMCGSLVDNIGGHTPVEPAKLNCAVVSGPREYIFNGISLYTELEKNDACIICEKVSDVEKTISMLLGDKNKRHELMKNAYVLTQGMVNVSGKILKILEDKKFLN